MSGENAENADSIGPEPYVAVVYFHGMGSQRRYEETSRLIDSLDALLTNAHEKGEEKLGLLRRIKPKMEPARVDEGSNVSYIGAKYFPTDTQENWQAQDIRFYESYWAPVMAGASSATGVAKWIVKQVGRPWQTLRSPWRQRQRLRRAALADLREQRARWPDGIENDDFGTLAMQYAMYDNKGFKREYPQGDFEDFLRFIHDRNTIDTATKQRIIVLARAWRGHYIATELRNSFLLVTILLALILSGVFALFAALTILDANVGLPFFDTSAFALGNWLKVVIGSQIATGLAFVLTLTVFLGIGKFLKEYMGDVEAWSTYEETNAKHRRRRQVIASGMDTMRHVLADLACKRVVVISHSLGTSIAHDTILALTRANRASNPNNPISGPVPLAKISHFVTLASPIDKVNYFFENFGSAFHRYTRVVEDLRGDIRSAPFTRDGDPHVHWVNFWDEADVISGALHSPTGKDNLDHGVDNIHVSNLEFPAPGASHSAYFDNRTVIGTIGDIIFHDRHSFRRLDDGGIVERLPLGPGEDMGRHRWTFAAAIAIPWVGLAMLLSVLVGIPVLPSILLGILATLVAWLVFRAATSGLRKQRTPL